MNSGIMASKAFPLHVIAVGLHDRPGAAHSVADVFSARGLQMEAFQGTSDSLSADGHAALLILFYASLERASLVPRVLKRLSSVRCAELLAADDPRLVQSVLIATTDTTPPDIKIVALDQQTALATGSPSSMQAWLTSDNAPRRLGGVRLDVLATQGLGPTQ